MAEPGVRGYLILNVEEASGKTNKDQFTWDTNTGGFEAFVKVEVRGGPRNVKVQTNKKPLVGETITWHEDLKLELLEGSNELRLMLCREKVQGTKRGTSVIAACGIYVNDILEACPIDKYFELFKPNAGGDGGYIRISMNFVRDMSEVRTNAAGRLQVINGPETPSEATPAAVVSAPTAETTAVEKTTVTQTGKKQRKRGFLLPLLLLAAAGAAGGFAVQRKRS